jgi:hypothetical protein
VAGHDLERRSARISSSNAIGRALRCGVCTGSRRRGRSAEIRALVESAPTIRRRSMALARGPRRRTGMAAAAPRRARPLRRACPGARRSLARPPRPSVRQYRAAEKSRAHVDRRSFSSRSASSHAARATCRPMRTASGRREERLETPTCGCAP